MNIKHIMLLFIFLSIIFISFANFGRKIFINAPIIGWIGALISLTIAVVLAFIINKK